MKRPMRFGEGTGSLAAVAMVAAAMANPDMLRRQVLAAEWRRQNAATEPEKVLTDFDRRQLDLAAEKRERKRKARAGK